MEERKLYLKVWHELAQEKNMVFMVGPRQSGKTTLAQIISSSFANNLYFNWDILSHRTKLIANPNFFEDVTRRDASIPMIIFDEIHKFKDWKNYLTPTKKEATLWLGAITCFTFGLSPLQNWGVEIALLKNFCEILWK